MPDNPAHDRLKHLFKDGFTAMDIAVPLVCLGAHEAAVDARTVLIERDACVAGVFANGVLGGYVRREELTEGLCENCMHTFAAAQCLGHTASYQEVIEVLADHEYCFVTFLGQVTAFIQKQDMQRPSVRMWLFGLITIAEMIISDTVERSFPHGTWQEKLSEDRLDKARALQAERQNKGQELRLMDCLYLADKARILTKDPTIRNNMGFESRKEAKKAISQLESLRNSLAHAHDIVTYDWTAIVEMSRRLDRMISRL
jgi:hypothetical protein